MNFYTTQMRSGPAATAALMLAVALLPAGCGGEQSTAADTPDGTRSAPRADSHQRRAYAHIRPGAVPRAEARRCRRALGDFLDAAESLENSVAVGVSYDSYLSAVNHVRASYAEAEADDLPLLCLARVATPAEAALNAHIEAANAWGECLADSSCDPESVEPELQRRWSRAADRLGESARGLRALGEDRPGG